MRWRLIIPLSLTIGLAMGCASVMGWTGPLGSTGMRLEPILWLFIAFLCALIIALRTTRKPFLHGLLVGLILSMCNSICQSVFNEMYFSNNPDLAERFQQTAQLPPRVFVLITGTIIGLIYGSVLGGLSMLFGKLIDQKRSPRSLQQ